MNHPVAVRAQQGQVMQPVQPRADRVEGHHMMALDITSAASPVHMLEVKAAHFTAKLFATGEDRGDLPLPQLGVALPRDMAAQEQAAFTCRKITLTRLRRRELAQLPASRGCSDRIGASMHLLWVITEPIKDHSVKRIAVGTSTEVVGMGRRNVGSLAGNSTGVPERWLSAARRVQWQLLEQAGQLMSRGCCHRAAAIRSA
jgi:hypothetical protein